MKFNKTLKGNYSLAFSNSNTIIAGSGDEINLYKLSTLNIISHFSFKNDYGNLLFSENDKFLGAKDAFGSIKIIDLVSLSQLFTRYSKSKNDGSNFIFLNGDKNILDGDWDGNLTCIDLTTKKDKIIKHFNNSSVKRIQFNKIDNTVIICIYQRQGYSIYERPFFYFNLYEFDRDLLFDKGKSINLLEGVCIPVVDIYRNKILMIYRTGREYYLYIYSFGIRDYENKIYLDVDDSIYTKIDISSGGNYVVVNISGKTMIFSAENYNLLKYINLEGDIRFSSDDKFVAFCSHSGECTAISTKEFIRL